MRVFELARIAVQAQVLVLRAMLKRQSRRIVLALCAMVFLLSTFALLEVSAVVAVQLLVGSLLYGTLLIALAHAAIIAVLLWLASRNSAATAEDDALKIRQAAVTSMKTSVTITSALRLGLGALRTYRNRTRKLAAK